MEVPRMWTVKKCINYIKQHDENTDIKTWFLMNLLRENKIKHRLTGTKYLVNIDSLLQYLNGEVA